VVRTTIDLPEDLLHSLKAIARDRHQTLSQAATDLIRRSFEPTAAGDDIRLNPVTGLPVIYLGRPTTSEDVRSLDNDE
jgi:hypothetical protein